LLDNHILYELKNYLIDNNSPTHDVGFDLIVHLVFDMKDKLSSE